MKDRTDAVYEDFPGCPEPPVVPLPQTSISALLVAWGIANTRTTRVLLGTTLLLGGFRRFAKTLPPNIATVLKFANQRTNTKCPQGPVQGVTIALADPSGPVDPFTRAAALLKAVWDLHDAMMAGRLAPDMCQGAPTEMRQFPNLFGTMTVPDGDRFRLFKTARTNYALVISRKRFYTLHIDRHDSIEDVAAALTTMWNAGEGGDVAAPIGILSSGTAATQVRLTRILSAVGNNRASFEAVRNSFVTICLDFESAPATDDEAARLAHSGRCENRWWQASLQLVIFGNAKACVICNYCAYLDGNVMTRAAGELARAADAPSWPRAAIGSRCLEWREVPFTVPDGALAPAYRDLERITSDDRATFDLVSAGRVALSERGLDPVPAFVVALQLATYNLTGRLIPIGQFLTMSKYRYMGLTIALATSPQVKAFVEAVAQRTATDDTLRALLRSAMDSHVIGCRSARARLDPAQVLALFMLTQTGVRHRLVMRVLGRMNKLFGALNLMRGGAPGILLSAPSIPGNVTLIGRPGIRLPQLDAFAMHYQIDDHRIRVTITPGRSWGIANRELMAKLEETLDWLLRLSRAGTQSARLAV